MYIVYTFSDEFCGIRFIKANKPQSGAEAINQILKGIDSKKDCSFPFQAKQFFWVQKHWLQVSATLLNGYQDT